MNTTSYPKIMWALWANHKHYELINKLFEPNIKQHYEQPNKRCELALKHYELPTNDVS